MGDRAVAAHAPRADWQGAEPSLGLGASAAALGQGSGRFDEPSFAAGAAPGDRDAGINASLAATVASNDHSDLANPMIADHQPRPEPEPQPQPQLQPQPAPAPEPVVEPAAVAPERIAAADVEAVISAVFEHSFPDLHPDAYDQARANFAVFAERCAAAAADRLLADERSLFAQADIQLLLLSIMGEIAKRRDEAKCDVLVSLLIGRIKNRDNPDLVELLEESIAAVCQINVAHLRIVVMRLYLRSLQLRTDRIEELETVVKYATHFGQGADFSNLHTGPLFTRGLLLYNGAMDRVEGQILRAYARLFEVDDDSLRAYRANAPAGRELVQQRLNLSQQQAAILESLGKSQCGRATATGVGWAAAAAFIELETGQPADWERAVA